MVCRPRPEIAKAQTAAKRKSLIKRLEKSNDKLFRDYRRAADRAETMSRIARKCGAYPLLSGGDTNLNSLFIERAHALVKPNGMVGLLVPSGIASDQSSAPFFQQMTRDRRLQCVLDFFNKRYDGTLFFPDVYYRFKFCAFVTGHPNSKLDSANLDFSFAMLNELRDQNRVFPISPEDIARINPNSGTAPIFRSRRDLELTTSNLYEIAGSHRPSIGTRK